MKIKVLMPIPIRNFYELYKYGTLRLDREACAPFDGYDENKYPAVDPDKFIKTIPLFDDQDQGIILECELDEDDYDKVDFNISGSIQDNALTLNQIRIMQVPICLRIEDVVRIYPLTENALSTLPMKIGGDVILEKPVFQNLYHQSVRGWEEISRHKGAQALFDMSGFSMPDEQKMLDSFLKQAGEFKSKRLKPVPSDRFILHALVYERREPFPKSDIGILYDLCMILAHKETLTDYRKSKFYEHLETLKSKFDHSGLADILKHFEGEPLFEKVRGLTTHAECHHRDYITASLFTKYKELLRDDKYRPREMIREMQELFEPFQEETKAALYLIGAFFDYKRFHNDLYISKQLRIIRVEPEIKPVEPTTPSDPTEEPKSQPAPPAEPEICPGETEKAADEIVSGKETEPTEPPQHMPGEQLSDISAETNSAQEPEKKSDSKSETPIDKSLSGSKSSKTNEGFQLTPAGKDSRKGGKRGKKETKDSKKT